MLSGLSSNKLEDQNKNPRSIPGNYMNSRNHPYMITQYQFFPTKKKLYFSCAERFIGYFSDDKYSFECVQPWVERTI